MDTAAPTPDPAMPKPEPPSRRALLRHLWGMVQTRAEAAAVVVSLQRAALTQGLVFGAVAVLAASAFLTAVIVLIAVAAPPEWRGPALGAVALLLLVATVAGGLGAAGKLRRDAALIADFRQGLKLDLALVNLALRDPDTEDDDKLEARERARQAVQEAAEAKQGTALDATAAASAAATAEGVRANPSPLATEREMPQAPVEVPEEVLKAEVAAAPRPAPEAPVTVDDLQEYRESGRA
jgi:uncharacterized membrane protein YqjE